MLSLFNHKEKKNWKENLHKGIHQIKQKGKKPDNSTKKMLEKQTITHLKMIKKLIRKRKEDKNL